MKSRNPVIEFDRLQMYFGEPYIIDVESAQGTITIKQPTIGDIIRIGEKKFYSTLNIFTTNTTAYRLPLWNAGIDWNEISDFNLFITLVEGIDKDVSDLIFEGLDFSKFQSYVKQIEGKESIVLYDAEAEIEINEEVYFHISQYLRSVFNTFPDEKITQDKTLKQWYITKDTRDETNKQIKKDRGESSDSSIQSVISACVNHPGFKYKLKELREVGVCEFYDSVKRLQVYENTTAVMKGMYSGFVDSSKIPSSSYNFMKDI